ncbi:hypothetical protein ACH5RR_035739 [Cinchona calisaya]|uniref:Uncharacterized protein n=1 Tax=Cinchona calisaya TaxID=153742 RepID=A0ABD2Y3C4_9GENT
MLELDLSSLFSDKKELEDTYNFPIDQLLLGELNLKQLTSLWLNAVNVSEEQVVGIDGDQSLLKLKHLEIISCSESLSILSPGMQVEFGEMQQQLVKGCKYECLEEVEFLGWNGLQGDAELFTHSIEAAESLERVTVDSRDPFPDKFLEEQILSLPEVSQAWRMLGIVPGTWKQNYLQPPNLLVL